MNHKLVDKCYKCFINELKRMDISLNLNHMRLYERLTFAAQIYYHESGHYSRENGYVFIWSKTKAILSDSKGQ